MNRFVLFGHTSLMNPSVPTFTLNNGTENLTLTGDGPDNPFNNPWDAFLSAYYWNTLNVNDINSWNYMPFKLLAFVANVILVLVLLNMVIALMK